MIRSLHQQEEGSSSILVIILMVVMMVFGLAVLTTSLSNQRLSDKKQEWTKDYYQLEGEVEIQIAAVDAILLRAEAYAKDYLESKDFLTVYNYTEEPSLEIRRQIYNLTYMDAIQKDLSQLIKGNKNATLYMSNYDRSSIFDGVPVTSSQLEIDTYGVVENDLKHITLTLTLFPADGDNLSPDYSLNSRYKIVGYVEWQEPFVYDQSINFEDPFEGVEEGNPDDSEDNPFTE